jgi:AcrR family transcriptional regulator
VPVPPTRPALREKYDRRQQEVADAAARLFAERGFESASMADLTGATGLAAGGLYHYFDSKEQLLISICDQLLVPLLVEAREIVGEDATPQEHLRRLIAAWVSHIEAHLHHMLVFQQARHVIEREPQWRAVRKRRRDFEAILDGVLEQGERDGVFRFDDRALALLAVLGMVNYTPQWFRPRGRLSAAEIASGYSDAILKAYGA